MLIIVIGSVPLTIAFCKSVNASEPPTFIAFADCAPTQIDIDNDKATAKILLLFRILIFPLFLTSFNDGFIQ